MFVPDGEGKAPGRKAVLGLGLEHYLARSVCQEYTVPLVVVDINGKLLAKLDTTKMRKHHEAFQGRFVGV
jgi:hypothetical protein